jgi:hypothetical protein
MRFNVSRELVLDSPRTDVRRRSRRRRRCNVVGVLVISNPPASCAKPPTRPLLPPPNIAPSSAGWQIMGRPNDASAASSLIVSSPVRPGIMSTPPAPASRAKWARWMMRCAGALMHGAYMHFRLAGGSSRTSTRPRSEHDLPSC